MKENIEVTEQQQSQTDEKVTEIPQMSCGYIVGVQPDGNFYFQIMGDESSITQLAGIHTYATCRIKLIEEINLGYGFPVLSQQNSQLLEILKTMALSLKNLENKWENK